MIDRKLSDIFNIVEKECKGHYRAKRINNKLMKNIANFGLKKFMRAEISRGGEYEGLTIEVQNDMPFLITDFRIQSAITYIIKEDFDSASRELNLNSLFIKYGDAVVLAGIKLWLDKNDIKYDLEFDLHGDILNEIRDIVLKNRHNSLDVEIIIISTGGCAKTGNPVVPDDWIGRKFLSGADLHNAMNKLPWRVGKPPVTYCCTYSMIISEDRKSFDSLQATGEEHILIIESINGYPKTILKRISEDELNKWNLKKDSYIFMKISKLILILQKTLIESKPKYVKTDNVGYLSSLLQKCIRRGEESRDILATTISRLAISPSYNLPDQKFIRVSGMRQLFWRSFISIIEEVSGYTLHQNKGFDLLDIFGFAIVSQIDPNIQFKSSVIGKLVDTMIAIQRCPIAWNWRSGNIKEDKIIDYRNRTTDAIKLALHMMPMMKGDRIMLEKANGLIEDGYQLVEIDLNKNNLPILDDDIIKYETQIVAMDMHCHPNILIKFQGCLPWIPDSDEKLNDLSHFIWNYSSKYNYRIKNDLSYNRVINLKLRCLIDVQENIIKQNTISIPESMMNNLIISPNNIVHNNDINHIPEYIGRLAFILIFGAKYRLTHKSKIDPAYEVVVTGTKEKPCKIKGSKKGIYSYIDGKDRFRAEKRFISNITNGMIVKLPPAPDGYRWKNIKNNICKISARIIKENIDTNENTITWFVDGKEIEAFDARIILERIDPPVKYFLPEYVRELVQDVLYINQAYNISDILCELDTIAKMRRYKHDDRCFDWIEFSDKIPYRIWIQLYARIKTAQSQNEFKDIYEVHVGPIDRSGNKTHNSISYQYEGVLWRILILLSSLYPTVLERKTDNVFHLYKRTDLYVEMISELERIIYKQQSIKINEYDDDIIIKTTLWDHQRSTVDKIVTGYTLHNRKGFGDASHVGAGKTLTALSTMANLYMYNKQHNLKKSRGFAVLLPTDKLYKTWSDEIKKHTEGFDVIYQSANGSLSGEIKSNTILITTMSRMREHPLQIPWILNVIDECLTVQNKESLQTESAFISSLQAQYGVLMMSATFFRSRFDKLMFMLGMLQTGIPENRIYLDTILTECMVCNITENERIWKTEITKIKLNKDVKKEYDVILKKMSGQAYDKIYGELVKLIHEKVDYVELIVDKLKEIEKVKDISILVYAKSKDEADRISKRYDRIWRYGEGERNGRIHTVLSYAEGTYGLNDLVCHNCILTRPAEPDRIVQMKGRLDRYGQKSPILTMYYLLLEDTIEEAGLFRLEMARKFFQTHIMPLAEFYKIAITGIKK